MFGFTKRRRKQKMREPFPDAWKKILRNNVPYYKQLTEEKQEKLQGLIQIFLDEKNFEGCGGLQITDEIKVTIAAQACVLLLGLDNLSSFYPDLRSVLVYPRRYFAPVKDYTEGGTIIEGTENRWGESWSHGNIVLAWDQVKKGASDYRDGQNLVFHEFAHHLDYEYGVTVQPDDSESHDPGFLVWARVLSTEYKQFLRDLKRQQPTVFDEYGSENLAEFFAVVTESFFEQPKKLHDTHPKLYHQLTLFYKQDPLEYLDSDIN